MIKLTTEETNILLQMLDNSVFPGKLLETVCAAKGRLKKGKVLPQAESEMLAGFIEQAQVPGLLVPAVAVILRKLRGMPPMGMREGDGNINFGNKNRVNNVGGHIGHTFSANAPASPESGEEVMCGLPPGTSQPAKKQNRQGARGPGRRAAMVQQTHSGSGSNIVVGDDDQSAVKQANV
ncbi:hypothetical protein AA12717_1419 [Gluconacetobacter sacchari DSM 12717]|uniref:Uncharacterized protein n=2 Tax=Gluconacetobacter sacchari TaxID=92759 RepID=A0A7W4IBE2_9PROT|nr:hypothetical protein [Gluconacetobacter sacchari]MBB2159740.1 hypothetical protein [Gluconacetobacter sacchari]GBQ23184.1 hypothetical protein AA12717_1419 [Gluconacetobacter sacchari DSM 12717]